MQSKKIQITNFGSPEVMDWIEDEVSEPLEDQVRIEHKCLGLNFIDIYQRKGLLPLDLPLTLGMEGSGIIESVGNKVSYFKQGDRVAHCMNIGSYCKHMVLHQNRVFKIPNNVSFEQAAASSLQGLTAHYLLHDSWKLEPNHTILVQAAAGGLGLFLTQWAKKIGARVIGTVSNEDKANISRQNGCDETIIYTKEDFKEKIDTLTQGKGVDLILDGVGKETLDKGIQCLSERGRLVFFGMSSGPIEPVNINLLRPKSASISTGTLMTYTKDVNELRRRAEVLFAMISQNNLKVNINHKYSFENIKLAHSNLEDRKTTGSSIINFE